MLVSTPTKLFTHHNSPYDSPMSPSFRRHCTPPRRCTDTVTSFDSPMLTPSPLRQKPMFSPRAFPKDPSDFEDFFFQSPYKAPAPAHLFNTSSYTTQPEPIQADDEEGRIFLSSGSASFTPLFSPSSSQPLLTPVKQLRTSISRHALSVKPINNELEPTGGVDVPANDTTIAKRTGVGTKRKSALQCTPLKLETDGTFHRLAPLPPPSFATRTPQTKAEADAFIKKQTATLTKLRLSDKADIIGACDDLGDDSGCELDDIALGAALFGPNSSDGRAAAGKGKEKEEVTEAISPDGHIVKRRARTRPLSAELREQQALRSPSPAQKPVLNKNRPRHSGAIAFPSSTAYRGRGSPGSSSSEGGSPLPRRRISNGAVRPHLKQPQLLPRPQLSRQENLSAATLFFGPAIPAPAPPAPTRSRTNTTHASGGNGPVLRSQTAQNKAANRHSYGGQGSKAADWSPIPIRAVSPSPSSCPWAFSQEMAADDTDDDEDMLFDGPAQSSFTFSVTEGSPNSKRALPRKYANDKQHPEVNGPTSGYRHYGDALTVMPRASTSVSSLGSDDGLITPITGPHIQSGWPGPRVHDTDTDDQHPGPGFAEDAVDVEKFIIRTLAAASKGPAPGVKKVPGTPVKKVRTAFLGPDRPWQSAVASKIGLREECDFKKAPRKSLPAAFPALGQRNGKSLLDQATDTEDEEESPSGRRNSKYTKLGLGHPVTFPPGTTGPLAMPRNRWLMRRSSSGIFSSGSESTSQNNTPTRTKAIDWQLPKLQVNVKFSSERSASGSSTSSGVTSSPTNRRQVPPHGVASASSRRARPSLVRRHSTEGFEEEQPGRFERDFDTVEEVGSGEFGNVIKVRCKMGDDTQVYAIKKSKRFEGAKHRLRLREEVDILKHLSEAAARSGLDGRHPNVLAYIDSWEEDEALYIRTELCESGNLARFLWEYGRVFPRLDEARVWKIIVDLSNGLRFIHDAGVIHLDLKPSNVFVTKDGRFKIGDFGMASLWPRAKTFETDAPEGSGFEREGDKLYLAPEVLQGRYSKAADVFSFGMTILETASNIVVPDQGESWHRLRLEDFSQVEWEGSSQLFELIKQMMRTDPGRRITVHGVFNHPVVSRARRIMEETYNRAKEAGTSVFAASPLASVPRGFLEQILDRPKLEDAAMDLSA